MEAKIMKHLRTLAVGCRTSSVSSSFLHEHPESTSDESPATTEVLHDVQTRERHGKLIIGQQKWQKL